MTDSKWDMRRLDALRTFICNFCLDKQLLLCGILLIFSHLNNPLYAQEDSLKNTEVLPETDSSTINILSRADKKAIRKATFIEKHSPRNALLFGIVPGGGQIYNRRYWKLPIVYAGLGGLGYWAIFNRQRFRCYRTAYKAEVDADPSTINTCDESLSTAQLLLYRDQYLQRYEYAVVGVFAFYALTLVDAFVDAHLMKFDVSDDLSLELRPSLEFNSFQSGAISTSFSGGLSLQLRFRADQKLTPPPF